MATLTKIHGQKLSDLFKLALKDTVNILNEQEKLKSSGQKPEYILDLGAFHQPPTSAPDGGFGWNRVCRICVAGALLIKEVDWPRSLAYVPLNSKLPEFWAKTGLTSSELIELARIMASLDILRRGKVTSALKSFYSSDELMEIRISEKIDTFWTKVHSGVQDGEFDGEVDGEVIMTDIVDHRRDRVRWLEQMDCLADVVAGLDQ